VYFSELICQFLLVCFKVACVKFEKKLTRFCPIIAIYSGVHFYADTVYLASTQRGTVSSVWKNKEHDIDIVGRTANLAISSITRCINYSTRTDTHRHTDIHTDRQRKANKHELTDIHEHICACSSSASASAGTQFLDGRNSTLVECDV